MRSAVKVPIGGKGGMILLSTDVNATVGNLIENHCGGVAADVPTRRSDPEKL
jgi:hypothetical protein